jgi:alpha-aminoadipate carrier protein LysW
MGNANSACKHTETISTIEASEKTTGKSADSIAKPRNFDSNKIGGDPLSSEKCPDCEALVSLPDDAVNGEIVSCPDCGLDLEIALAGQERMVKPVVLEKEDWGE